MTALPDAPLPSPTRRRLLWWSLQKVLQIIFAAGFRYQSRGIEHVPKQGPALLLINHQSYLDPIIICLPISRPVTMLARKNLFGIPIVGGLVRNLYSMAIDRDNPGTGPIREVLRRLDHGFLVGMFPEGTRTSGTNLGPIKPGFISILRRADVPVIPVGIAGADRAMPRGAMLPRSTKIRITYGEPISPSALAPLQERGREDELLEFIRKQIQTQVDHSAAWIEGRIK